MELRLCNTETLFVNHPFIFYDSKNESMGLSFAVFWAHYTITRMTIGLETNAKGTVLV
jgi:hypothetical protein